MNRQKNKNQTTTTIDYASIQERRQKKGEYVMSGYPPSISPAVLSGRGFDDFQTRCGALFESYRVSPEREHNDFHWRANIKVALGLALVRIQFNTDWSLTQTAERGGFHVLIPRVGGYRATLDGQQFEVAPGKILLAQTRQVRHLKLYSNEMCAGIALYFDNATVAKVLSSLSDGQLSDCIDIIPVLECSSHIGKTLGGIARLFEAGAFTSQALQRSPKAAALLIEATLTLVLENLPYHGSHRVQRRTALLAPRHVHDAVDFMRAHLHQSLTMAEIAAASGVSVRSLQTAFRHFYDTTPMAHLRHLRLEEVHKELSSPENFLPVSEVAMKWGFIHMGRFAAQYRAVYGEYPSETVAGSQYQLH